MMRAKLKRVICWLLALLFFCGRGGYSEASTAAALRLQADDRAGCDDDGEGFDVGRAGCDDDGEGFDVGREGCDFPALQRV